MAPMITPPNRRRAAARRAVPARRALRRRRAGRGLRRASPRPACRTAASRAGTTPTCAPSLREALPPAPARCAALDGARERSDAQAVPGAAPRRARRAFRAELSDLSTGRRDRDARCSTRWRRRPRRRSRGGADARRGGVDAGAERRLPAGRRRDRGRAGRQVDAPIELVCCSRAGSRPRPTTRSSSRSARGLA